MNARPMIAQTSNRIQPTGASRPWLWSQHWLDVLFAHWPVAVADLRPHVPAALDLDTWEGAAWVSLVGFRLERIRRRCLPSVGFLTNTLELNLRTYVCYQSDPAIYFLSIHANNPLLVRLARWATTLPYQLARMSYARREGDMQFLSRRAVETDEIKFAASFSPTGAAHTVVAGSLEEWLLERYGLYVQDKTGTLFRTVVEHPAWQVQTAEADISTNTMGFPFGLDLSCLPEKVHFSAGVHAHIESFAEIGRFYGQRLAASGRD
jgi:uncharacterized protein YqjF (DUF2071 family)